MTELPPSPSRRALLRGCALSLSLGLLAPAVAAPLFRPARARAAAPPSALRPEDIQDLDRVSAYLNSIETLEGKFTQIAQNGDLAEGNFYMRRPGRLRFEYASPEGMPVIVADGTWVTLEDRRLKTSSRYPLNVTPLSILLRKDVDLAGDTRVVAVERQPGVLSVTARDDKGVAQGELTMIFRDPGLELRNWIIKDAQGYFTTVAVRDLREGVRLDPALFVAQDYTPSSRRDQ